VQASSDADIARRISRGDASALEDAYRSYAPRCRAVAYRVLADDALAQDAVQEAFISLWRHRDGLVLRDAGAAPWLVVVTRNAALNIARSTARRAMREAAGAPEERTDDPTETAVANLEAGALRDAIEQLPDEQRTVIRRAYFHGDTLREVAQRTGAPLGTVKRRAQLALARLSRLLGGAAS